MMRRQFSHAFKREAFHLVATSGVSVAQAARNLDIHATFLRRWIRRYGNDPAGTFPDKTQMMSTDDKVRRLRCEVAKLKAKWNIKKAAAYFAKNKA